MNEELSSHEVVLFLLLNLAIIIVVARVMGEAFTLTAIFAVRRAIRSSSATTRR